MSVAPSGKSPSGEPSLAVTPAAGIHRYPMAPLIRFTLLALPFLAPQPLMLPLTLALPLGLLLVVAATSERVELDGEGLRVGHPGWCAWLLRRGWSLPWARVHGLSPVTTSQGGRVWYVRSAGGEGRAYLLPQRVARFEDFLARFAAASGVDTSTVGRISPPWTYQLLAVLSCVLLLAEVIGLAMAPQLP
jgi:hypothetical protein